MGLSKADKEVIKRWQQIPSSYNETNLTSHLIDFMLSAIGIDFQLKKNTPNIGISSTLKPDILIYKDLNRPPSIVMENKKRVPQLAQVTDEEFEEACKEHILYKQAVGYDLDQQNNGIRQYLDVNNIDQENLATYGIVFNGDFFKFGVDEMA